MKISKKIVYKNEWFQIIDTHYIKNKKNYFTIKMSDSSVILPITPDNKILIIKQYRESLDDFSLELPAGFIDKHEKPIDAAKRELLEETGYSATDLKHLTRYYPVQGHNLQYIDCFVATKLKKISEPKLDDDEFVTVEKIPLKKIISMIKSGKIMDSKTICSVMIYASKKNIL